MTITQQSATPRPALKQRPMPAGVTVFVPNRPRALAKIGLLLLATSVGAAILAAATGVAALFLLSTVGR